MALSHGILGKFPRWNRRGRSCWKSCNVLQAFFPTLVVLTIVIYRQAFFAFISNSYFSRGKNGESIARSILCSEFELLSLSNKGFVPFLINFIFELKIVMELEFSRETRDRGNRRNYTVLKSVFILINSYLDARIRSVMFGIMNGWFFLLKSLSTFFQESWLPFV